ncbi:MAG: peptidoglycan-associated lipoprotein Pal, partial [Candidatus Methylomirabilis sp.]|nr:peptidoglycan-associated lipoprotein Pal [Deltaproteobacteria bacterium]
MKLNAYAGVFLLGAALALTGCPKDETVADESGAGDSSGEVSRYLDGGDGAAGKEVTGTGSLGEGYTISGLKRIHFDFDKSDIRADQAPTLDANGSYLKQNGELKVQVEGHCDERGTNAYNLALGQRRAESAKRYLVKTGVEGGRLSTISYGEERPLDPGHDESAWAQN